MAVLLCGTVGAARALPVDSRRGGSLKHAWRSAVEWAYAERRSLGFLPGKAFPGQKINSDVDDMKRLPIASFGGPQLVHRHIVVGAKPGEGILFSVPRRAEKSAYQSVAVKRVHGKPVDVDPVG